MPALVLGASEIPHTRITSRDFNTLCEGNKLSELGQGEEIPGWTAASK
jgi:hypothetical protein